jgi:hypothetical protein
MRVPSGASEAPEAGPVLRILRERILCEGILCERILREGILRERIAPGRYHV